MKFEVRYTTQFKKDIKLAKKQNQDLRKLYKVIEVLAQGKTLEARCRDHELSGSYKGVRECHVEPDWLLTYEYQNDILVLVLNRIGSHSEIFKK